MEMRLIKVGSFVVAVGFDLSNLTMNPRMISWVGEESSKPPFTDYNLFDFDLSPEFVRVLTDHKIIIYQPGKCIEMNFVAGTVYGWSIKIMKPEA